MRQPSLRRPAYFYPRPPCGGRLLTQEGKDCNGHISIHALRAEGDASEHQHLQLGSKISIHALRAEGDLLVSRLSLLLLLFLSTPSVRRATLFDFYFFFN